MSPEPTTRQFSSLSISSDDPLPYGTDVRLNGEPVPGLQAITLRLKWGELTSAELTIAVDELSVDTETLLRLLALATDTAEANSGEANTDG